MIGVASGRNSRQPRVRSNGPPYVVNVRIVPEINQVGCDIISNSMSNSDQNVWTSTAHTGRATSRPRHERPLTFPISETSNVLI